MTPEDLNRRLAAIEAAQRITALSSVALVAWTVYGSGTSLLATWLVLK